MIEKITEKTTVGEIIEVLKFMQWERNIKDACITIWSDFSGGFKTFYNEDICSISDLKKYLENRKSKIMSGNMTDSDYDKILENPEAVKKILSKLPVKDILQEIDKRIDVVADVEVGE